MDLLAAEITAVTGKDPGEHFQELVSEFGMPYYTRIDAAATPEQKAKLLKLSPAGVKETDLAGEPILEKLTTAPETAPPSVASKSSPRVAGLRPALRHRKYLQNLCRKLRK